MKHILLILFVLIPFVSYAQVYKTIDANGDVVFSDKPTSSSSVPVELPKTNSVPSSAPASDNMSIRVNRSSQPQPNQPSPMMVIDQNNKKPYTKFLISSPTDQETIHNQPSIPVKIAIQPDLQEGDVIQVYLDGAPIGNAEPKTEFEFTAPDRGTHILSATLFDKSMRVLKQSNANTIFVHQAHLGSGGGAGN